MTDLETRLIAALAAGAAGAPAADGLATGARRRRARRRTRSVVGVVVAVLLVVVPGSVLLSRDGARPEVVRPVEPTSWRTETWRGLSVEVPVDWGYGDACASDTPVVDVPTEGRLSPGCPDRSTGLGVVFFDSVLFDSTLAPGQVVAGEDGTWVGYYAWIAGGGADPAVWVTAEDRATVQRVLDSAQPASSAADPRTESFGDLTLEVPSDWVAGETCGNTGDPVVTRATSVMCPGLDGYGLRFGPYPPAATLVITDEMRRAEGPNWPAGSWWANVQVPGSSDVATVVTPDRATGQRILDSVRVD